MACLLSYAFTINLLHWLGCFLNICFQMSDGTFSHGFSSQLIWVFCKKLSRILSLNIHLKRKCSSSSTTHASHNSHKRSSTFIFSKRPVSSLIGKIPRRNWTKYDGSFLDKWQVTYFSGSSCSLCLIYVLNFGFAIYCRFVSCTVVSDRKDYHVKGCYRHNICTCVCMYCINITAIIVCV